MSKDRLSLLWEQGACNGNKDAAKKDLSRSRHKESWWSQGPWAPYSICQNLAISVTHSFIIDTDAKGQGNGRISNDDDGYYAARTLISMGRRSLFAVCTSVVHGLGSLFAMIYESKERHTISTKRHMLSTIITHMLPGVGSKLVRTNTSLTNCVAKMQRIILFGMEQALMSIVMATTAFTI
jgi:hypothetical protein